MEIGHRGFRVKEMMISPLRKFLDARENLKYFVDLSDFEELATGWWYSPMGGIGSEVEEFQRDLTQIFI